jgi:hypothetical protein
MSNALTGQELAAFEQALQLMEAQIDDESDLIGVAMLPDRTRGWVREQLEGIDRLIDSKEPEGGGDPRPVKKIRLVSAPKRIKSIDEWNTLKTEMDRKIATALDQGVEVELF